MAPPLLPRKAMTENPACGGSQRLFSRAGRKVCPWAMGSRPSKPADDPISATGLDDRYAGSGEGGSSYMPPGAGDDLLGCTRYVAAFSFNKAELCSRCTSNPKEEAVP